MGGHGIMCAKHRPEIIQVTSSSLQEVAARTAVALRLGQVVVLPTDTVYGLAADSTVPGAADRLFRIKGRDLHKPVALLAADLADIEAYGGRLSPAAQKLARRFWPGALTLVLPAGEGFEGFRIPDLAVTREILRAAGGVLRVTSANRSGESPALSAEDALQQLGADVDLIVNAGPAPGQIPSTVVKVDGNRMTVLRAGAIPESDLQAALGQFSP
jgi:tRNA threonylcarbamoyl adenosine modification protein (Sua5/YciO/YrdC/YwlC family)